MKIDKGFPEIYSRPRILIFFLLGFCFILYFVNLDQWDLWNPDEPRYAEVSREIASGGDWILMHANGMTYADKPPLFFWMVVLSSYLWGGFNSFSVRFSPALFGTLTVLLTFFLGKRLYGPRAGFLSGLILATSFEFTYRATRANIDTTLVFFTTASLFFFLYWHGKRRGEKNKKEFSGRSIYGFYICMALATLTKGPVGFLLPLLVSLIYLAFQRDWTGIKRMRLLTGMGLFVLIVLCWYLPALFKGGEDYLNATLLRHTLDRYAKGWSKVRPIYYYFYSFPLGFLPWSIFLPGAIAYGFTKGTTEKMKGFFFLFLWLAVVFLFFSLSKGKRALYLLPIYPASSLMVGKLLDDFLSTPMDRFMHRWISFPLFGLMGLGVPIGIALLWVVSMKFPSYLSYSLPLALLWVCGSLAMFVSYHFKHRGAMFYVIVVIVAGGFFYVTRAVFPLLNPYRSARPLSQEVVSARLPGERLGAYVKIDITPYNFYTGIVPIVVLGTKEEILYFLNSSERVFCLLPYSDFIGFQLSPGGSEDKRVRQYKIGSNDDVLISNR